MSRARNIKPGFFKNDLLAECSPLARILFCGLWCEADREGRLEDRPKRIKADCLPYDDCDCDELLAQLADRGFITRYEQGGSRYIAIPEFLKHQNPHCKEAPSSIPAPYKHGASTVQAEKKPERAGLIPDSPSLIPDTPKKQKHARSASPSVPVDSPTAITIPLNTGDEYPVTEAQCSEFAALYPVVDVPQQLRSLRAWALSNPAKRKTKAGILRFVNAWLARAQDQGGAPMQPRAGPAARQPTQSRTVQAIQALSEVTARVTQPEQATARLADPRAAGWSAENALPEP